MPKRLLSLEYGLTDRQLLQQILIALGAVAESSDSSSLGIQEEALGYLISQLEAKKEEVANKRRVVIAELTRDQRLTKDHPSYWAHMTHCYGLIYDDDIQPGNHTRRHACKYYEDDICPAALFEDPWEEYQRAKKAGEIG
jgi:hypothetical protein